ncbi:MAG: FAD binding domain-containing protein [Alphaproteobacteria bacterium]
MYETNYHKATSLADAATRIEAAEDGKLLAGGHTLIPTMKQRLAAPTDLIDLGDLDELKGIALSGGQLTIGAATTHTGVARSSDVIAAIPALADLAGEIGDPHVRNRGTIGGSVANNDPAADYPAAVLALDAKVETNQRTISAADYFTGMFETALGENEIIKQISFTVPEKSAYCRFPNPASRYPMAGVFIACYPGNVVRVAVTGASQAGVYRWPEAETALSGNLSADALNGLAVDAGAMLSDIHGTGAYRANLVAVMAKRAVASLG